MICYDVYLLKPQSVRLFPFCVRLVLIYRSIAKFQAAGQQWSRFSCMPACSSRFLLLFHQVCVYTHPGFVCLFHQVCVYPSWVCVFSFFSLLFPCLFVCETNCVCSSFALRFLPGFSHPLSCLALTTGESTPQAHWQCQSDPPSFQFTASLTIFLVGTLCMLAPSVCCQCVYQHVWVFSMSTGKGGSRLGSPLPSSGSSGGLQTHRILNALYQPFCVQGYLFIY